jgi:hypothetical protein
MVSGIGLLQLIQAHVRSFWAAEQRPGSMGPCNASHFVLASHNRLHAPARFDQMIEGRAKLQKLEPIDLAGFQQPHLMRVNLVR